MRRAQIARHHVSLPVSFNINPRGSQDMAGRVKADAGVPGDVVPGFIVDRVQLILDAFLKSTNQAFVARKADLQRVLDSQRQQLCRRTAAIDRPLKPGREQIRQSADVVDVHVRQQQRFHSIQRELDLEIGMPACVVALKQSTVDEDGRAIVQFELVA